MTENYIFSRNLLVSDIDMRDIPWNKLGKEEREDYITYLKNYILETLKDYNLEPHFVVFSGRGFHLYYRFQKMVLAKKDIKVLLKDTQQVLYKKIKEVLGFLPDENGSFREVQIDMVSALAQKMRLPGSINQKSGLEVEVIYKNLELEDRYLGYFVNEQKIEESIFNTQYFIGKTKKGKKIEVVLNKRIQALLKLIEIRVEEDRIVGWRNKFVMNIAFALINLGLTDEEVIRFIERKVQTRFKDYYWESRKSVENVARATRAIFVFRYNKLKERTIRVNLGMTEEEIERIGYFEGAKERRRKSQKKAARKKQGFYENKKAQNLRYANVLFLINFEKASQRDATKVFGCTATVAQNALEKKREGDPHVLRALKKVESTVLGAIKGAGPCRFRGIKIIDGKLRAIVELPLLEGLYAISYEETEKIDFLAIRNADPPKASA